MSYIGCSNDTFGFFECFLSTTTDSTCAYSDNYLSVECRTSKSIVSPHFPSINISLFFSHLNHIVTSIPSCYNGQTRLANNYTTSDSISGTVEVCVDGVYVPICGHSDAGVGSLTDVAQYICNSIGYYGEWYEYTLMGNSLVQ